MNCDSDAPAHPPMQSVFKLPLAVATLHLVEQEKFSLEQPIRFLPSDRILPHTHSPLQDKSDNAAADLILRIIGGPQIVDGYIHSIGIGGFHLEDGEGGLSSDVAVQYRNRFEPAAAAQLLRQISENSLLSAENTKLLLKWMEVSPTVLRRRPMMRVPRNKNRPNRAPAGEAGGCAFGISC